MSESATNHLVNLASGKAASKDTESYLLNTLKEGEKLKVKFLHECNENPNRFLQPLKRRKIENFAAENNKQKVGFKKGKTEDSIRDTFARMLVVAAEGNSLNMRLVMEYPLTEYPLSLAHSDGTIMKSPKSKLLNKLETLQDTANFKPKEITATVIDGGLILHSILSVCGQIVSYGTLARNLLVHVCGYEGMEVHVLFDTYLESSLKSSERKIRGSNGSSFSITGSEQKPMQNGTQLLRNESFKNQLATFLLQEWGKSQYGSIILNKVIVASHGGRCFKYTQATDDSGVTVSMPPEYQGEHEEADTLIAFHLNWLNGKIIVRSSDTDVLIILVGMPIDANKDIYLDCGSGNSRRYISVAQIQTSLNRKKPGLPAALPGLHAFTGSDFTESFYGKGKLKPFTILENNVYIQFIEFFMSLRRQNSTPNYLIAEEFCCHLYGFPALKSINEARYAKLLQMTGKINQVNAKSLYIYFAIFSAIFIFF